MSDHAADAGHGDGNRAATVPAQARRPRLHRLSFLAPHAILTALVALALAAALTVSLGEHRPWTTLPLAALIGWALWRAVRPHETPSPTDLALGRGLLLVVLAWVVLHGIGHAEYLIVSRDPGFLTLSSLWLVDHPSTDIPSLGAIDAAAVQANMLADAEQAWNLRGDMIQPQGAKMLPALLSMGGWLGGTVGVLVANVVVGGVGLIALGLVAREMVGPRWALVPVGLMGLSVAHIGLSRAAYTEPLTLLLVFAGLLWAWRGIRHRRAGALVAAGIVTGATALVRIDGAAFAAGALVATTVVIALTARGQASGTSASHGAPWRIGAVLAFALPQAAVLAVGYASLWRWSQAYLERLMPEARTAVGAYVLALAVALVWVASWNRWIGGERLVTAVTDRLGQRGSASAGWAVSGLLVALATRPLWTTVHRGTESESDQFTNGVVEYFQRVQGLPLDPTRTYAESTVTWLALYLTWPVVILAIAGFGIATTWALRHRPAWGLLVIGCLLPTTLYLLKPEIVPDQIWAIRRFEPAGLPAFALAATVAAKVGLRRWAARPGREVTPRARWRLDATAMRQVRAASPWVLALLPALTWISVMPGQPYPLSVAMHVFTTEMDGARAQVDGLCEVADGRPIVLYGTSSHFGTLRVSCDVPVVLALVPPTEQTLVHMTQVWGQAPVVVTRHANELLWTSAPGVLVDSTVNQVEYRLQGIPRVVNQSEFAWYAGIPDASGSLVPLAPPGDSWGTASTATALTP